MECVCSYNILISGNTVKEMPGSVASGTHCILATAFNTHGQMGKLAVKDC